jgi:hypothetical protein
MVRRIWLMAIFLAPFAAWGQATLLPAPTQIILDADDIKEFREIFATIAAKDQPLLFRWFVRVEAKARARTEAEAKK